jgi:general stress protein 26
MSEIQNLSSTAAIKKMKELAMAANICLFVTNLSTVPLSARPMGTQQVDDEGNIWFLSKNHSDKNIDIAKDNRVQLFYSNGSSYEYLSIYGTASILTDQTKIEELWTPIVEAWFKEGKQDPSITLIKVKPVDAYYWDTKDGKMISLLRMAISAITDKPMDDRGVQGKLKVY